MRRRALFLLGTLLAGCGESPEPSGRPDAPVSALTPVPDAAGAALYERYCALCHGDEGQGYLADDAPALANAEFLRTASDAFLTAAIADGRPGTPMSAFGEDHAGPLDDGEIASLVRHLRSWQREPRVIVDSVRVRGDAARGRSLYTRSCAGCHGPRGEGINAVALANPAFLATASDGFIQYAIAHGRRGTRMPPFQGRLQAAQIDDLVAFVRSLASGGADLPEPAAAPTTPAPTIPPLTEMELVIHPDGPRPRFTLRSERFVPAAEVERELARGARMIIMDARATSDWLDERIEGAIPVPYYELSGILDELPRDGTWMIAYCGCPHAASGRVVDALREQGFTNTAVLDEGIGHWVERGYRTASGLPAD